MLVRIGEKHCINIMAIHAVQNVINKEDPNRKISMIYYHGGSIIQLDEEESKHFNEFINKILPDISTEQGQNHVIQTLQKATENMRGNK